MHGQPFTKEEGLAIQAKQMSTWKLMLRPWAYRELMKLRRLANAKLTKSSTGYDVWRGTSITEAVGDDIYFNALSQQ